MSNRNIVIPSFDLSGKATIITGGTRGLGFGIASAFAAYGADVVITARTANDVEIAAKEINDHYCKGGHCIGVAADSGIQEDIDKVIATTVHTFGKLSILVNNAGVSGRTARILSEECDEENFDTVMDINLKSVFLFSKAAASQMKKDRTQGKIINISSVGALIGESGSVAYSASKAGVLSLTRTMANEFAQYGITVNAVCPGYIITPLNEDFFSNREVYEKIAKKTSFGRLGTIEEVAGPVLAMASDSFNYMTGTYILLDGGQTISNN